MIFLSVVTIVEQGRLRNRSSTLPMRLRDPMLNVGVLGRMW